MASDDVLYREAVERIAFERIDGTSERPLVNDARALLTHDAALRARIEELEATVREELCNCGPTDNPDLDEHADYCRARRALESDHGEDDGNNS